MILVDGQSTFFLGHIVYIIMYVCSSPHKGHINCEKKQIGRYLLTYIAAAMAASKKGVFGIYDAFERET
jgi:hypothetical protein